MSKHVQNLVAATLPATPTTTQFIQCFAAIEAQQGQADAPENEMYDPVFNNQPATPTPRGTAKTQQLALKIANKYLKVQEKKGIFFDDLDTWFCGLAKFVLSPSHLFDGEEEQRAAWEDRVQSCAGICAPRQISVLSLKTYTNALVRAVRMQEYGNRYDCLQCSGVAV